MSSLPKHGQAYLCVFNGYALFMHFTANVHLEREKSGSLYENIYLKGFNSLFHTNRAPCSSLPPGLFYILCLWLERFLYLPQGRWREGSTLNWCLPHCRFISGDIHTNTYARFRARTHTRTHTYVHHWYFMRWREDGNNLLCGTRQVSACPLCRP